jgi:hypothetical protein
MEGGTNGDDDIINGRVAGVIFSVVADVVDRLTAMIRRGDAEDNIDGDDCDGTKDNGCGIHNFPFDAIFTSPLLLFCILS